MALNITVISAKNLPNIEVVGKVDPIATINFQGIKKSTECIKNELDPVWNANLLWELGNRALSTTDFLELDVKDWERVGRNRLLGQATVSLKEVVNSKKHETQHSISLLDGAGRQTTGEIVLQIKYVAPQSASSEQLMDPPQSPSFTSAVTNDPHEGEYDASKDIPKASGVKERLAQRRMPRIDRDKLSTRPENYQLRVKIWEARQLLGANINPVCKVTVSGQVQTTRVKHGTNKPYFDEVFFFNFFISPAELFDEIILFQLFNSRMLRSDAVLGGFNLDLGAVYQCMDHSIQNKWLLLTCDEDSKAGAKGYLQISCSLIGPGDDAPVFKKKDEDDDIESNLLQPPGMTIHKGLFRFKIFHAEDIPQMDSSFMEGVKKVLHVGEEEKELVDPYFIVSYAGRETQTDIKFCNDHPEWNQELVMPISFPSMCERIKFQMRDWDRLSQDDFIGTCYLELSDISSRGEEEYNPGFLPTFGPCFVNFYGSPREFSDVSDKYENMNTGKEKGMAYRGRALVSVETVLADTVIENPITDITTQDIVRAQKFLRRRKFRLYAAFMEACMINDSESQSSIEFEVSIGNFGNKLDKNVVSQPSSTQPTNAVYDGCHYYFLPWLSNKPLCVVDCNWEDVAFRMEALNMMLAKIKRLESNLKFVKTSQQAGAPASEVAAQLIAMIDSLIQDCRKKLPPLTGLHGKANELDHRRRDQRLTIMMEIITAATKLRENATDIEEALEEVEGYKELLKEVAVEPQGNIPDVIFWMISNNQRIAYRRIPTHQLLFSSKDKDACGSLCGKVKSYFIKYPGARGKSMGVPRIPAMIRAKLWFGLELESDNFRRSLTDANMSVFAETYENQMSFVGQWTSKGIPRPKFSDAAGKLALPKDKFDCPNLWRWDGDWFVSLEQSLLYDVDAGMTTFLEDCYEQQSRRFPGSPWEVANVTYTTVRGDPLPKREEINCPSNWQWDGDWIVDINRPVDEEGYEYCVEATAGKWTPAEKPYHLCRRKRWIRPRSVINKGKKISEVEKNVDTEGWEYATLFSSRFHALERKMDMVRRRRWHRRMITESPRASLNFSLIQEQSVSTGTDNQSMSSPRLFLIHKKSYKYQLRAYMYQARDLIAADSDSFSDPYAYVSFLHRSGKTEIIRHTLCPTWDQTIIFDEMEIHGDPKIFAQSPPDIIVEIFDSDNFNNDELLGRCQISPIVKIDAHDQRVPRLAWHSVHHAGTINGELLASFELFLITEGSDLPYVPPMRGNLYIVPNGIRPVLQRTGVEFLCWGVRNMKKYLQMSVESPTIEFEIGGKIIESSTIKDISDNPNFPDPVLFVEVDLPREELYTPPINIKVRDNRAFGRKPIVGVTVVKHLHSYRCKPNPEVIPSKAVKPSGNGDKIVQTKGGKDRRKGIVSYQDENSLGDEHDQSDIIISVPEETKQVKKKEKQKKKSKFSVAVLKNRKWTFKKDKSIDPEILQDDEIDWWSKYYASIGERSKCHTYIEKGFDKVIIYEKELEDVPEFGKFDDFCETFHLSRGKHTEPVDANTSVGEFKGLFRIYSLPGDLKANLPQRQFQHLPPSDTVECLVRLYVVRAFDLQPKDKNGLSDPYLIVKLGNTTFDECERYLANTLNPFFGRVFEMKTRLPTNKDLKIQVVDKDILSRDDLIGETVIDLENRYLTKFRATCGLPQTYCTSGVNRWRDCLTPSEIIEAHCKSNNYPTPVYDEVSCTMVVNGVTHDLNFYEASMIHHEHLGPPDQRLALHVLNSLPLVKEHLETRPLYTPLMPGIDQGRVQMWVDIFPMELGAPGPPIDISPRLARKHELRCIIWNTADVILDEISITGERMSDIYVKGWLAGQDEKQETDVHYRSLNGEGNFNWRFVFEFDYIPPEQTMVISRKEHFWSLDQTEIRVPPTLIIQIWDNDKFSPDDFLGTLELDLNHMPAAIKNSKKSGLKQLPDPEFPERECPMVSLFEQKRVRGWWPCINEETGTRELTGKVEMELEVLDDEEAKEKPSAPARDEPNQHPTLEPPIRPETSFQWIASPWKSLRYIIWYNFKYYIIYGLIFLFLIFFIVLFVYNVPSAAVNKVFGL